MINNIFITIFSIMALISLFLGIFVLIKGIQDRKDRWEFLFFGILFSILLFMVFISLICFIFGFML